MGRHLLFPVFKLPRPLTIADMQLPPDYISWLHHLGFDEISFGCGGVKLFTIEELDEHQIGYSRSAEGKSLCDGKPGSWRPEWIVIGHDTAMGDPIILDTSSRWPSQGLRVMTAMHGEGAWDPKVIADSLHGFADALRALKEASVGREYPVALEQNPLSEKERERVVERFRKAIGEGDMEFWKAIF